METNEVQQQKPARRPRFWVGPLTAGCCFALGYGITQRVLTLQGNAETPSSETFESALFPGESLEAMRLRNGGQPGDLQVDLVEVEAQEEAERQASQAALQRVEQAGLAKEGLQAVVRPVAPVPQPQWTQPTWSEPPPQDPAPPGPVTQPAAVPAVPEQAVPEPITDVAEPSDIAEPAGPSEPVQEAFVEPVVEPLPQPDVQPAAVVVVDPVVESVVAPQEFFAPVVPPPPPEP